MEKQDSEEMFCSINLYLEIRNQKWLYKFSSLFTFSSNIQSNIDPLLASQDQSIFHQHFSFLEKTLMNLQDMTRQLTMSMTKKMNEIKEISTTKYQERTSLF